MAMGKDIQSMSGPEKAALLMLAVGEDNAARLFSMMDDDEIRELSQSMANLGTVTSELIEQMLVEFADRISTTGSVTGNYDSTERLLLTVMDKDKVSGSMEEIRGPAGPTLWDKLATGNGMRVATQPKK